MSKSRKSTAIIAAVTVLAATAAAFAYRQAIHDSMARLSRGPIPKETALEEIKVEGAAVPSKPADAIPAVTPAKETAPVAAKPEQQPATKPGLPKEMNLRMAFFPQAPFRIWDEIHEDACEEASMLMIQAYIKGERSVSLEEIDRRILDLVDYQNEKFGDFRSTDAEQSAAMMREHLGMTGVRVLPVTSADDIRAQIAKGRPVMIPAAGRLLENPNFRHGGPPYHMLVIKGYTTDGKFVTHDPGTRVGADYVYEEAVIMDAIHDYNGGDVLNGRKVMIVVED